ncbi:MULTISPECIES: hypothetical protein [Haloferax]|uniref:Uncharacterized protein n=1 Tax=Haloferax massiliensis TaxID=1476858 RepID=A0A0D6JWP1_9EURY|nr:MULTISPECIES: hypothetical protein [Haloferax]MDS0242354.1 hypothetical protein [Haloferax sp. S2CR25]MDS0445475.1 hypothetical protein [Haloferax sp. S2CR25-2]CQR53248.1 hypothetical protein BN996_03539 [Haloferax massiliensis]
MRIPLPKHTLVALALVGALLTTVVAAGLVSPTLLPGTDTQTPAAGDHAAAQSSDAPTPNPDFTPAVQSNGDGDGDEEHEEGGEEHEEYGGDEEHEDRDDEEHEVEHEGDDD